MAAGDTVTVSPSAGKQAEGYKVAHIKVTKGAGGSVLVASLDSKALIYKGSALKLDGALSVNSASDLTFKVDADASGNKEGKAR